MYPAIPRWFPGDFLIPKICIILVLLQYSLIYNLILQMWHFKLNQDLALWDETCRSDREVWVYMSTLWALEAEQTLALCELDTDWTPELGLDTTGNPSVGP